MFVQQIQEFIKSQSEAQNLSTPDHVFMELLSEYFEHHSTESTLNSADLDFVQSIFRRRWYGSADTDHDYVNLSEEPGQIKSNDIKKRWIDLANELSIATGISSADILMPPMKIQNILDFIRELNREVVLSAPDTVFVKELTEKYSSIPAESAPTPEDLDFIINQYKSRWDRIMGTSDDYTLNSRSISLICTLFAKKLAHERKVSYLQILMHNMINHTDPNDGSVLTLTTNPYNTFYRIVNPTGDKECPSIVLYRKRVACEQWMRAGHGLFINNHDGVKTPGPVPIDVLHRLKLSDPKYGKFSIGRKEYSSFWDFMRKEIFPYLKSKGEYPKEMLLPLLRLVEKYYFLKSRGGSFQDFKNGASAFLNLLYESKIENIHFLLGQKIIYKDKEHYLLDLFIESFESATFCLDSQMESVLQFLFNIHPALKSVNKDLDYLYQRTTKETLLDEVEAYNRCCALFVSFYTTRFDTRQVFLSELDKETGIPNELVTVYKAARMIAVSGANAQARDSYQSIIDMVSSLNDSPPRSVLSSRTATTSKWMNNIVRSKLTEQGGNWLNIHVLLGCLVNINFEDERVQEEKNKFLDELIRTSAQTEPNADCFEKRFRVNYQLSQFLVHLDETQRRALIIKVAFADEMRAEQEFIKNCDSFIKSRLAFLGYVEKVESSIPFFSSSPKTISPKPPSTAHALLINYLEALPLSHLSHEVEERIKAYLVMLNSVILSERSRQESRDDSVPSHAPFGLSNFK